MVRWRVRIGKGHIADVRGWGSDVGSILFLDLVVGYLCLLHNSLHCIYALPVLFTYLSHTRKKKSKNDRISVTIVSNSVSINSRKNKGHGKHFWSCSSLSTFHLVPSTCRCCLLCFWPCAVVAYVFKWRI